jgi:uncharacterized protein (DUF2236 family)
MRARDLIEEYENQPPRHQKRGRRAGQKRCGIECWSDHFQKWMRQGWYATERARDDAFKSLIRATKQLAPRHFRKVNR